MDISIIIPVYNEDENLSILCEKLINTLSTVEKEYEIIFIDDGSVDKSWSVISQLTKTNERVKGLNLRRNFGQTIAMAAGFDNARGDILITIDSDLQNDPADIPLLLKKMDEGFDVVSGWRRKRKDPFLTRRLPSLIANKLISIMTGVAIHDLGCTLKAYRKDALKDLKLYGDMHRLLSVYVVWLGAKIAEVEVTHYPRLSGKSKYGLNRTFKLVLDLITAKFLVSFATKPSYIFGGIGIFLFLLGSSIGIFVSIRALYFTGVWVSPLIFIMTICIVGSIQFVLMGLLGEVAVRTYHESQNKAPYLIANKLNID